MRLIKKYPNRKLYDTKEGVYISLHQIRELVEFGEPFTVIGSLSKEDLTKVTIFDAFAMDIQFKERIATSILLEFNNGVT